MNKDDIMTLLNKILKNMSCKELALKLNISKGTINRWIELKKIPSSYNFELMKLLNIKIDYSKYTFKDKDQFYTHIETATYCYNIFQEILKKYENNNNYTYIEPSAGSGNFVKVLPKNTIALDVESKNDNILEQDYLTWKPNDDNKKYIVFGNPPFGLRGQLALKFINHSFEFADYVCFILPQLFESDGKGSPMKRVIGYNLLHTEKLNTNFINPDNTKIKVNCIFQIWSKFHINKILIPKTIDTTIMKIYSLSDGGTSSSTRNAKMFQSCHIYIPSTCFGIDNMKPYDKFEELPCKRGYGIVFNKNIKNNILKFKNIIWSDVAFLSTNSAYNIRISKISNMFI